MSDLVRAERLGEYMKEHVSEFIARESNHSSLITITRVLLADSLKSANILITVYPEDKEEEVMQFLKRRRSDVREYIKKHIKTRMIPFVDFEIDKGEKNRQNLDALLQ